MILRRYITRQVSVSTMLVVGFLAVMVLGGHLIRFFGLVAEGELQLAFLFRLIGYTTPFVLELILPLAFFVALMLTFGRLYADSEMSAINASGVSRGRLGLLLMPLIALLFVFESYLSLVAKPWGARLSEGIWQEQAMAQVFDLVRPREFISSGDYHLYVGSIGENREYLADVIIVQMGKDGNKDRLIFASRATQVPSQANTIQLDLHQGRRYEVSPDSTAYSEVGFDTYRMSIQTSAERTPSNKTETVPLRELWGRADTEAMAELGYRLSLPWLMVLAVMMALPMSAVSPRQGRWLKLVPAILVFVVVALILISLKKPIAKQKVGLWAYPLTIVMLMGISLYLNYHGRLMAKLTLGKHNKSNQGGWRG